MKKGLKKVEAYLSKNKLIVLGVALCMLGAINTMSLPQIVHNILLGCVSVLIIGVSVCIIRERGTSWTKK